MNTPSPRNTRLDLSPPPGAALARLALLALLAVSPVHAATLGVPGDFPTIQEAVSAAAPGDRVLVEPGVYVGTLNFAGKDVVVESTAGAAVTVLDGSGRTAVWIGPGGGLVGFTIDNTNALAVVVRGADSLLEANLFDGSVRTAPIWAVVYASNASPVMLRNRFRGYECNGVTNSGVVSFLGDASPFVANNVFDDNACVSLRVRVSTTSAPEVVNNTFVGNTTAIEILRNEPVALHTYRNNLVFGNSIGLALETGAFGDLPTWDHNLVYGNLVDHGEDPDPLGTGSNVSADPLLSDLGASDYRPLAGSPAVDAGESALAPWDDFEGTTRPLDGNLDGLARVDIGAFEMLPPPEPEVDATIDVKPGSERNPIRLRRGRGVVPVALLGDEDLDVVDVDPGSLRFGPAGAPIAHSGGPHFSDVDGDGHTDLVGHFRTGETGISRGDDEACMTGEIAGTPFTACDAVWTR